MPPTPEDKRTRRCHAAIIALGLIGAFLFFMALTCFIVHGVMLQFGLIVLCLGSATSV